VQTSYGGGIGLRERGRVWTAPTPKFFKIHKFLRGGADKSFARPTYRCRRPESIVSLERKVCPCAELYSLVTESEKKHVRRRARFQQHGDAGCHQVPPPPAR